MVDGEYQARYRTIYTALEMWYVKLPWPRSRLAHYCMHEDPLLRMQAMEPDKDPCDLVMLPSMASAGQLPSLGFDIIGKFRRDVRLDWG